MRLPQLTLPRPRGDALEYLKRLVVSLHAGNTETRKVVNTNDAIAASEANSWMGIAQGFDYGVEYGTGGGYVTICQTPAENTCKVVSGISAKNASGGAATIGLYIRYSGVDLLFDRATSVPAGTTVFFPETIIVRDDWYLRGYTTGASIEYTTHYSIAPYGVGLEQYNVAGTCSLHSNLIFTIGTSPIVVIEEPLERQRHIVRTVTHGNGFAGTPTTDMFIREKSTSNTYDIKTWVMAGYGTGLFSHRNESAIVLKPDTELVVQQSIDPIVFVTSVHYATADVSK